MSHNHIVRVHTSFRNIWPSSIDHHPLQSCPLILIIGHRRSTITSHHPFMSSTSFCRPLSINHCPIHSICRSQIVALSHPYLSSHAKELQMHLPMETQTLFGPLLLRPHPIPHLREGVTFHHTSVNYDRYHHTILLRIPLPQIHHLHPLHTIPCMRRRRKQDQP